MSKLKIEFQKPKLTLCNTNYAPLGILTNKTHMSAHNVTLTSKVNETPCLSFDIPDVYVAFELQAVNVHNRSR